MPTFADIVVLDKEDQDALRNAQRELLAAQQRHVVLYVLDGVSYHFISTHATKEEADSACNTLRLEAEAFRQALNKWEDEAPEFFPGLHNKDPYPQMRVHYPFDQSIKPEIDEYADPDCIRVATQSEIDLLDARISLMQKQMRAAQAA